MLYARNNSFFRIFARKTVMPVSGLLLLKQSFKHQEGAVPPSFYVLYELVLWNVTRRLIVTQMHEQAN